MSHLRVSIGPRINSAKWRRNSKWKLNLHFFLKCCFIRVENVIRMLKMQDGAENEDGAMKYTLTYIPHFLTILNFNSYSNIRRSPLWRFKEYHKLRDEPVSRYTSTTFMQICRKLYIFRTNVIPF